MSKLSWKQESAEACMLSEERAQRALQSSEAHQQSIAKLTADGVIQALQHKQCEANLASVTSERDVLQAEVSQSRGPLYEEASDLPLLWNSSIPIHQSDLHKRVTWAAAPFTYASRSHYCWKAQQGFGISSNNISCREGKSNTLKVSHGIVRSSKRSCWIYRDLLFEQVNHRPHYSLALQCHSLVLIGWSPFQNLEMKSKMLLQVRKDVEARISETMRQLHDKDMQIEQLRHEHRQVIRPLSLFSQNFCVAELIITMRLCVLLHAVNLWKSNKQQDKDLFLDFRQKHPLTRFLTPCRKIWTKTGIWSCYVQTLISCKVGSL